MKRKPIGLYLESASDYRITKMVGNSKATVTLEEAKALYETGAVEDYNLAFGRLIHNKFDIEAVKAYYARKAEPSRLTNLGEGV
jgi:hypothetical protein